MRGRPSHLRAATVARPVACPAARGVVGALAIVAALALAACAPGLRPVQSLPPPVAAHVPVVVGPGEVRMRAASARVLPGALYHYEAMTHCGFTTTTFDFDGSYWTVVGPPDDGQGNPIDGLGNPTDSGTIELVGQDQAVFTSAAGVRIQLTRGPAEGQVFLCD